MNNQIMNNQIMPISMGFLIYHFRYLQSVPESWPCSIAQGGDARQSLANRPRVGALRALAPAWHGFGCHMASPVGFFLNPNEQLFSQHFSTMFSAQLVVLIVLSSIF
jgi:hypothetical protein